jgi:single-strand DNA-binding protein
MANFNLNKVILGGRITADPELKQTQTGISTVSFSVAVNRRFATKGTDDNQTDFINVRAWRQTAEFINRFFNWNLILILERINCNRTRNNIICRFST